MEIGTTQKTEGFELSTGSSQGQARKLGFGLWGLFIVNFLNLNVNI